MPPLPRRTAVTFIADGGDPPCFPSVDKSDKAVTKIPVLLAGLLVLILCIRLVTQLWCRGGREVSVDDFSKAREALDSILIQTAAINRILSNDDLEFVSRSGQADLQRLFLREPKRLAMHWFRKIKKQVRCLMTVHLRLAARAPLSSPRLEVTLCLRYILFMALSNSVLLLFWLLGPFETKRTLVYVIRGVERFFTIFGARLEGINTAHLGSGREFLVH